MGEIAKKMGLEISRLRKVIAGFQKSVSINLCCYGNIENPNVECGQSVIRLKNSTGEKHFIFGNIFIGDVEKLGSIEPLLNSYVSGDNACILAHGRTGEKRC